MRWLRVVGMEHGAGLGEDPPHAAGDGELRRARGDSLEREMGEGGTPAYGAPPPLPCFSSRRRPGRRAPPPLLLHDCWGRQRKGEASISRTRKSNTQGRSPYDATAPRYLDADTPPSPSPPSPTAYTAAQLRKGPPAGFSCTETKYTRPTSTVGRSWNRLPSTPGSGSGWSDPARDRNRLGAAQKRT
jgi:hypothetical protein